MPDSRWATSSQAYGAFYTLPPRDKVKDRQHALLVALDTPGESVPAAAAAAAGTAANAPAQLLRARVVTQPGDGSCLFHSLSHGSSAEPLRLRHAIADFIESQPDAAVGGEPLREWIRWDSDLSPDAYAARMRGAGNWGGAIELAVFARLFGVAAYVYEAVPAAPGSFRRIASFRPPHETEQVAHLLYRSGVHYDALQPVDR